ncbi:hypothetical protein [Bacillus cereus]|uniref:Uncharacterized protein n=1 Tax=Bacillus cereus TaxID=1396 RepID=A0AAE9TGP2_BACCE|nr:hypothetical protein [Bacillus cereus]UYW72280.1 hypothetical protein OK229_27990 [Bacillus cereus]
MNTDFEVFYYEPNFMFPLNAISIGRAKLIFCNIKKDTYTYDKTIFIIQNGPASITQFIENACSNIQNRILSTLNLCIQKYFNIYIVNYKHDEYEQEEFKDLAFITLSKKLDKASFEKDMNFEDLGLKKEQVIDALNDFILDVYTPYQLLNAKTHSHDSDTFSSRCYIKSNLLFILSKTIKNKEYKDRLFKAKLNYVCESLIKTLDNSQESLIKGYIRSIISDLKDSNPENSDCYQEIEKLLPSALKEFKNFI